MLSEDRVDAIFKEMDSYGIDLIPDPSSLGPQYFRDLIAQCRNHLNRVGLVLTELDRERLTVSSELRRKEASYAIEYDECLANDVRVKALASIDDRKSTAGFILKDARVEINTLKDRLHILDSVHKVVTFRNRELQSTMTAIKDQQKAMQSEIRSGSFYGDERTKTTPGTKVVVPDEISADDLAKLMATDDDSEEEPGESAGVAPPKRENGLASSPEDPPEFTYQTA